MELKQFYSKSAHKPDLLGQPDNWRKILSNFYEIPGGLIYEEKNYPTVEHYFQAMKISYSDAPEKAVEYEVDNILGEKPASEAKTSGSKTSYKKQKITLNEQEWNKNRDRFMMEGLKARLEVDEVFKNILRATRTQNYYLLHYEKSSNSYWGGTVPKDAPDGNFKGQNTLGKMLMELSVELSAKLPKKKAKFKKPPQVQVQSAAGYGSNIEAEVRYAIAAKELAGEPLADQVSSIKALQSVIPNATADHVRIHRALKDESINSS